MSREFKKTLENAPVKPRGLLIAFEGCDCSGKSSIIDLLFGCMINGDKNYYQHFPNEKCVTGELIKHYLEEKIELEVHCAHLLFSANRYNKRQAIMDALAEGKHVLVDRYIHSGIVYSAARGVPMKWCTETEKAMPDPDLVIYLEADLEIAADRICLRNRYHNKRPGRKECDINFQKCVQDKYNCIMDSRWRILNTSKKPLCESVKEARGHIYDAIAEQKRNPREIKMYE
jgi:dTMP kinase